VNEVFTAHQRIIVLQTVSYLILCWQWCYWLCIILQGSIWRNTLLSPSKTKFTRQKAAYYVCLTSVHSSTFSLST